jgi:hypothetical protein
MKPKQKLLQPILCKCWTLAQDGERRRSTFRLEMPSRVGYLVLMKVRVQITISLSNCIPRLIIQAHMRYRQAQRTQHHMVMVIKAPEIIQLYSRISCRLPICYIGDTNCTSSVQHSNFASDPANIVERQWPRFRLQ